MYSSTLSLTSALDGVGGQSHAPAALPPGMSRYPLCSVGTVGYFPRGQAAGACSWPLTPPSSDGVRNVWSPTYSLPYAFMARRGMVSLYQLKVWIENSTLVSSILRTRPYRFSILFLQAICHVLQAQRTNNCIQRASSVQDGNWLLLLYV